MSRWNWGKLCTAYLVVVGVDVAASSRAGQVVAPFQVDPGLSGGVQLGLLVVGLEASWHGEAVAALLLLRHGHSQGGDDGDPDGLVNLGTILQRSRL